MRLIRSDRETLEELAAEIRHHVFCLLDTTENFTSDEAGMLAAACERQFRRLATPLFLVDDWEPASAAPEEPISAGDEFDRLYCEIGGEG